MQKPKVQQQPILITGEQDEALNDTFNHTTLQDINKKKRISMWIACVMCLITIPIFYYYDNRQISDLDLVVIDNLTLVEQPDYTGGKRAEIHIYLTNTERTLVVNLEELSCVNKDEILNTFSPGDIISIKILSSDKEEFYSTGIISRYEKIYGLRKNGREYIELACRNAVSTKKTIAAIYASAATAVLCFALAVWVFRPTNKSEKKGIIYSDPITVISLFWLIVLFISKLILG